MWVFCPCGGYVVVYVPPRCTGSAEVMYNKVQARRCRFRSTRRLARRECTAQLGHGPVRHAVVGHAHPPARATVAGCHSGDRLAVHVRVRGAGDHSAQLCLDCHLADRRRPLLVRPSADAAQFRQKVMAALVHELSQSCPEARLDDAPASLGSRPTPRRAFRTQWSRRPTRSATTPAVC